MEAKVLRGKMSARTVELYRQRWASHLQPRVGNRKLSEITKATVIKVASDLQKGGLSESTANGVLIVLRGILRHARHIDAMTFDPFAGIDPSALPSPTAPSDQHVLRADEVWKLIEQTTPSYRAIVTTLAWSGARVSEILGLRWADIDFVDRAFKIEEQPGDLRGDVYGGRCVPERGRTTEGHRRRAVL